jgi:hypothetical protein
MVVKEMARPRTIASGVSRLFSVEYAITPGSSGRTHGDAMLTIPANSAIAKVAFSKVYPLLFIH